MAFRVKLFEAIGVLRTDNTGLRRGLRSALGQVNKFNAQLTKTMAVAGGIIGTTLGVALGAIAVKALKLGAAAEESEDLFRISMGKMEEQAREFSIQLARSIRGNEFEIRKNIGTFNQLVKSMGVGAEEAADMANALSKMTVDSASFFNKNPEEAFQKLKAGLVGSSEPLLEFGVNVQEAALQEEALAQGIKKKTTEMTMAEKVMLRYSIMVKKLAVVENNAADTRNSLANLTRGMGQLFDQMLIKIKPLVTDVGKAFLMPIVEEFERLGFALDGNKEKLKEWAALAADWTKRASTGLVRFLREDATPAFVEFSKAVFHASAAIKGILGDKQVQTWLKWGAALLAVQWALWAIVKVSRPFFLVGEAILKVGGAIASLGGKLFWVGRLFQIGFAGVWLVGIYKLGRAFEKHVLSKITWIDDKLNAMADKAVKFLDLFRKKQPDYLEGTRSAQIFPKDFDPFTQGAPAPGMSAGGGTTTMSVNIGSLAVRDQRDVEAVSRAIAQKVASARIRTGSMRLTGAIG